jgi:hypothetical protein
VIYRLGIISLAHAPVHVTDFPVYYLRNKSWKPECALSFNIGWRILVFYPEPEDLSNILYEVLELCPLENRKRFKTNIKNNLEGTVQKSRCKTKPIK